MEIDSTTAASALEGAAPRFGSTEYREQFRGQARTRLDGRWYALINLFLLLSIMIGLALSIQHYDVIFWVSLPAYFLIVNGVEYWLHRYPMHRKMTGMLIVYEHVTIHHNFYANEHFFFEEPADFYAAILPHYIFIGLTLVITILGGAVGLLFGADRGLAFAFVAYAYYLIYELLHFSYHTPQSSFVKRIPFLARLSRMHIQHHQTKLMAHYNFNITFPIFDVLLGTLYKEPRGGSRPG